MKHARKLALEILIVVIVPMFFLQAVDRYYGEPWFSDMRVMAEVTCSTLLGAFIIPELFRYARVKLRRR